MLHVSEHEAILLRGGRIIDPVSGRDDVADLAVVNGLIADSAPPDAHVLDATDWVLCPGLMDIHVHLREPGHTHKETIETGTAAAAAGGFTFVACMPNTDPAIDRPEVVRAVLQRAEQINHCRVGPIAAITLGRAGRAVTDFAALRQAGAIGFSDDGDGVGDESVMREAFRRAAATGSLLLQHCDTASISPGGVMHLGATSKKLGLAGLDPRAEESMIERDIALSRETGGRYHITHISTKSGIELLRKAKSDGLPVTAEVAVQHLVLTDEACASRDPNTKMHPPLRTKEDREACRRGLFDGTIDCVVTDHAPHTAEEKGVGFKDAPPGIVGLETAVGLAAKAMIETGLADWPRLVAWFTTGPAAVLGVERPGIRTGATADLSILAPKTAWTVAPERFLSRSHNTPFGGWELTGRPVGTIRGGRMTLHREFSTD
ncbi:MAG: dihydroorotase [Phycisphaerae bacterium]|jgi:dihydroorotase